MGIARLHRKRHNFSIVDNSGAEDRSLSWKARGILWYLLTKPDNWTVRISDLINQSEPDGRDSVRSGFKELEAAGYAVRWRSRAADGRFHWFTEIFECKEDAIEWKASENQGGFSVDGSPVDGKPVDIVNTEQVITDLSITEFPNALTRSVGTADITNVCQRANTASVLPKEEKMQPEQTADSIPLPVNPIAFKRSTQEVANGSEVTKVPPPPAPKRNDAPQPSYDKHGWLRLPMTGEFKLPAIVAVGRLQRLLALCLLKDTAALAIDEEGDWVMDEGQHVVVLAKNMEALPEREAFEQGDVSLRALLRYSSKVGNDISQDWLNSVLEWLYAESINWCSKYDKRAKAILEAHSWIGLFLDGDMEALRASEPTHVLVDYAA